MTKNEYLKMLKRELRPIKRAEREKSLAYFGELIEDRMEDGIPEETAVSELESVTDAAQRIISEASAQGFLKPKRSVWEIILLVLGFPLWFPLLLTVAIVVFTMYAVVWILIGALILVSVSFAVSGAAAVIGMFFSGSISAAFICLGVGLVLAGLGVALFIPALLIARAYAKATPIIWNRLINRKVGKPNE